MWPYLPQTLRGHLADLPRCELSPVQADVLLPTGLEAAAGSYDEQWWEKLP